MPYRRRYRRRRYPRRRPRRSRRFRRRRGLKMSVRRMPMYMPDAIKVPLKYTSTIAFASTTSDSIQFSLNDPYQLQPYGWDQWSLLYTHYYCVTSRVNVKCTPENSRECRLVLYPSQYLASTITSLAQAMQQKYAKTYNVGSSNSTFTAKHRMTLQKLDGFKPTGVNYIGNVSTGMSSTYTRYWNIWLESLSGETVEGTYCTIEIVYYVRFFRLSLQATS